MYIKGFDQEFTPLKLVYYRINLLNEYQKHDADYKQHCSGYNTNADLYIIHAWTTIYCTEVQYR